MSSIALQRRSGLQSSHFSVQRSSSSDGVGTQNVTVFVPPWDVGVCEGLVDEMVGAFAECAHRCPATCEERCPLPGNVTLRGGYAYIGGATTARLDANRQVVDYRAPGP